MVAHLGLIYTKHQGVEDGWWQIIVVDLVTFVRRLNLWPIIIEKEEESVCRSRNPFIEERA